MRAKTWNQGREDREPVTGKEGEECALIWDTLYSLSVLDHILQDWALYILHNHIISGDAVRSYEEECLLVNFVEISDLSLGDFW